MGQDKTLTIGKFGCLLTCLTMVADGFGANETPDTLNDKMKAAGGFQGALVIPAILPKVLTGIRYKKFIECSTQDAPIVEIDVALTANKPVIVEVDYSSAPGMQNHWVVLYEKKGDDYLIQDPWPYPAETKEVTLTARFGFAGKPKKIITGALWLEGAPQAQPPAEPPEPKPLPASGFAVYTAADQLALRQQPFVTDDNVIKRLPQQTKLFVLEAADVAQQKIGQVNQWLNVQETIEGYAGHVAAWYVALTPEIAAPLPPPAAPPAPPVPPSSAMVIYAATEGLALRTKPTSSGNTLIKRLPLNAQLLVLETAGQVMAKIGVKDQWLNVRDIEGEIGYVAAWYASTTKIEPALGPSQGPKPAPLVLRVIEDGLSLRSRPVISDTTLIKREPLDAELYVVDAPETVDAKLGVLGQWIKVRDIQGAEGYVAAWYVVKRPASP